MNIIIGELGKADKFVELIGNIESKKSPIEISGLTDVGMIQQIVGIYQFTKKPIAIITYNEIQAQKIYNNIKSFEEKVIYFPKKEIVTYDYVAESNDLPYERIEALNKLQTKKGHILVTTIEAVMQDIPSKETLYKNKLEFKVGEIYSLDEVKQKLVNLGYQRNDLIEGSGQFSVRGDIVDISINEKSGIRIEFWGDEVDSIRNFDIISQRSEATLTTATINPAHEYILEKDINKVCEKIKKLNIKKEEILEADIEQIQNGEYISKIDKYFNCFYDTKSNILEYLADKYVIAFDEIGKIKTRKRNIKNDLKNVTELLIEKERFVPEVIQNLIEYEDDERYNRFIKIYLEKLDKETNIQANKYKFNYREINYLKNEIDNCIKDIKKYVKNKKRIIILASDEKKAKIIQAILNQNDIPNIFEKKLDQTIIAKSSETIVMIGINEISEGFEFADINQVVISANKLIDGEKKKNRVHSKQFREAKEVVSADLKIGDFVVHKVYGIGNFVGVNTIKANGTIKDYIKIKYQDSDVLYVPTDQMDSVRKYVGGDGAAPKINKLGSRDWEKTKAKVKNNLREVAQELIELYAKREKAKGFAFSKDTLWQQEFEQKFPYQETEDQLICIEEVKNDMEKTKPMDRLLCGDVGYGKTEVALRAAFKAVMDQKQVAYLAPTTVLAEQQYKEFKERMSEYPIRVEILNRFKSKKYQDDVIRKLKLGEVDVVIGTHRILSKDVEFKDLGLLIIDEEHRFGVKAKEKIKEYKVNVDVLTMTATPIPRTLHMSIVGVRDMSVIYEPPHNRKPVQTYVLEYDIEVVKEAITKELERDGQVFYLYNNVQHIARKAEMLSSLVPEANVVYAHGQMTGHEIENIMQEFVNKKTNVLVCTTILESGIDIPNANTIIVENADRMGLAQLYQIRGRVGRADKQAYAYITYRRDKLLTEVADKRLKAIKEFTEFGSGFKIAMRDLEIRGAGSLIGEIQSGHLEQVGYETYCDLLDQVVKEIKGSETDEEIPMQIELNVTSYIPDTYISDSKQKIEVYQNIALCKNEEDIQEIIDELIDRFGNMPEELESLMNIARIKYMASNLKVESIKSKNKFIVFSFRANNMNIDIDKLLKIYGNKIKFSAGVKPRITIDIGDNSEKNILKSVINFLKENKT